MGRKARKGGKTASRRAPRKPPRESALERILQNLDPDLYHLFEGARKRIQKELRAYRQDIRKGDLTEVTQVLTEAFADTVREAVEMYEDRVLNRLPPAIRAPIERLLKPRKPE
ncbi:MAG: hypothetical protein QXO51_06550 [Halobacteria archaeon]